MEVLGIEREYKQDLICDFREFYKVSYKEIDFDERFYLIQGLRENDKSSLFSKIQGWKFRADRIYLALSDIWDLLLQANSDPKSLKGDWQYEKPYSTKMNLGNKDAEALGGTPMDIREAMMLYSNAFDTYEETPETIESTLQWNKEYKEAQKEKEI